jgi:hypothetical protein
MNITLFSQILKKINRSNFNKAVLKYQTDKYNKGINSWTHLVSMMFFHLAKSRFNQRNHQRTTLNQRQLKSSWDNA